MKMEELKALKQTYENIQETVAKLDSLTAQLQAECKKEAEATEGKILEALEGLKEYKNDVSLVFYINSEVTFEDGSFTDQYKICLTQYGKWLVDKSVIGVRGANHSIISDDKFVCDEQEKVEFISRWLEISDQIGNSIKKQYEQKANSSVSTARKKNLVTASQLENVKAVKKAMEE